MTNKSYCFTLRCGLQELLDPGNQTQPGFGLSLSNLRFANFFSGFNPDSKLHQLKVSKPERTPRGLRAFGV